METVELETGPNPQASVIWLHGLGADGHDFEPNVGELELPHTPIRFVFPHAPMQPVTINGGQVMRAWYDVTHQDLERREDEKGVRASQALVDALIGRERARDVAAARIVIAGFSQGGAIALQAGLRHAERLAGIMALSTYVPLAATLTVEASAANRGLPIFFAHGRQDPVIPFARARVSRELLESLGWPIEWHEYDMPHAVCPQELDDIGAWLQRTLG